MYLVSTFQHLYKLSSSLPFFTLKTENGRGRAATPLMSQHYYRTNNENMDHKYFLQWIFQRGRKCAVLIFFHYLNIVLLNLCLVSCMCVRVCALFGLKKSRVFIIFIDAIINDWCLFVWAHLQYACYMRVRVKIYTFDFFCLITLNAEREKKWMAKILLVRSFIMNHKTRLLLGSKAKKARDFWILRQCSTTLPKKSNNIMLKREWEGEGERERGREWDMILTDECVLKRNKWENFRQNWWQRQKKQLRINGKNKRNETQRFNSDGTSFSVRRKIRFVSWKMSLFQWV